MTFSSTRVCSGSLPVPASEAKSRQGGEQQEHQTTTASTVEREERAPGSRGSIQKGRKQQTREDDQETGGRLPTPEKRATPCGEQGKARRENAALLARQVR